MREEGRSPDQAGDGSRQTGINVGRAPYQASVLTGWPPERPTWGWVQVAAHVHAWSMACLRSSGFAGHPFAVFQGRSASTWWTFKSRMMRWC